MDKYKRTAFSKTRFLARSHLAFRDKRTQWRHFWKRHQGADF